MGENKRRPDEAADETAASEELTIEERQAEGDSAAKPSGEAIREDAEANASSSETEKKDAPEKAKSATKKWVLFAAKLAFAVGAYVLIFRKTVNRDGVDGLSEHIANLHWGWVVAAVCMQLIAITFATLRWRALLHGQGIRPSPRFLAGSIMIARFFGAFTPGGFTGFGGWRIFDVAQHTGKVARASATIATEMLLGQVAFGLVVMGASVYGARFIGNDGVLLVNLFFGSVVLVAMVLMARPALFRFVAKFLPGAIRGKVQTLVDAVCAYQGKLKLLSHAVLWGVGVHAFNNLIYVCAAQALGVELGVGEVFFASGLQIFATLIPASINGMGLRETAAVALYTSPAIGLPMAQAVLIPIVGFCCEMFVSAFGGLIFLARRNGYEPNIEVDDDEHEAQVEAEQEKVPLEEQPSPWRGLSIGLAAGMFGGLLVGLAEATIIILTSNGAASLSVLAYGATAYAIFCAPIGAGAGWFFAFVGRERDLYGWSIGRVLLRWNGRRALPEAKAYGGIAAMVFGLFAFALGFFRVRRDIFAEELVLKSGKGLAVLLACALAAAAIYGVLSLLLRFEAEKLPALRKPWVSALRCAVIIGVLAGIAATGGQAEATADTSGRAAAPESAGNVLFIVVDTLRADHLPSYGYAEGSTPNLDAFAGDAIRFDMAFANASWTRPSFASIMTGRLPSNHGVMAKPDPLPDSVTTIAEAMQEGGYLTDGIVTNFNVDASFNFQQGFDGYLFMEPDFVLGADAAASKLLLIQFLRQKIEKWKAARDQVDPGSVYRDAEEVNAELLRHLDERADTDRPFFSFVGYMDPHDPYYIHPYDGSGYGRAAHQHPDPSEAERLEGLYDGEITYWDEHFGQLIESLKERGLYDDLTIVITADHGEEFCDHGGFWHGTTLYDEQVRVPLFVKLPGARRGGTTVRHWVQSIDLMPSVLREVGLPIPDGVQGGNIFEGTDVVYAEESHEGNVLESIRERRGTDERKLIIANAGNPRGLDPVELYRVDLDPGERENVASAEEATVGHLEEVMAAMREIALDGAAESEEAVEMTPERLERLCGLGYMERESCCRQGLDAFCDE